MIGSDFAATMDPEPTGRVAGIPPSGEVPGGAGTGGTARALAAVLGIDTALLADTLFATLDRLDLRVAVKEAASGRYLHVNGAMAALLADDPSKVIGSTDAELLEPSQAATMRAAEQVALTQTIPTVCEHRLERLGQRRQFGITRLPLPAPDGGTPKYLLSVWVDQTASTQQRQQLRNALAQLEQQQLAAESLLRQIEFQGPRDTATGLYRPVHFEDQLRREIDLSSREHREFALVWIALDPPSKALATLGAAGRSRVLEALGRLLRSNTRAMDASCRLDDDRFAILLSGVGLATAHSRMEGLRRQCATQIVVIEGRELGFTVSMGVASFPHTANTEEALTNASDAALLEAQRRGGNHVALASIRFVGPTVGD